MGRNRALQGENPFAFGQGYVFLSSAELLSKFPNEYEIINKGISGNRCVDLYSRIKVDCWNLNPDIISILIGVNDIWHELESGNGVELDRFENIMRTLLKETIERLPQTKIVLIEPFFLAGTAVDVLGYEAFSDVLKYAAVIEKLSNEFNLPLVKVQEKFNDLAAKYGAENYLYDGVHPNVAGAKVIADEWLKVFYDKIMA